MAHPNGDDAGARGDRDAPKRAGSLGAESSGGKDGAAEGPDPVIGAGITLLGIFLMGTGGARDAHYVFDVGVGVSLIGAVTFVLFVALSAMKQDRPSHAEPRG